jgi:uncharacterized membrane protein (UPF0127 family)
MKLIRTYWLELAIGVAVVAGIYWGYYVGRERMMEPDYPENPKGEQVEMQVGEETVRVEVRDTEAGKALGLSGRANLGKDEGMLFVYEQPARPTFWMKDMRFDLDVLWITEGKVVQIDEQVAAPTAAEPRIRTLSPAMEVDQVLEVAAGWVAERGVEVGDSGKLRARE